MASSGSVAARLGGAVVAAGNALAMVDIGARDVVPGANDNLSGVGVVLSVASALRDEPPTGLRVILLSTGAEESFSEGMEAFARRHFDSLPPESTYVICVDTVGSPHLLLLEGEGMLGVRDYPKDFLRLVSECADRAGVRLWPGLRFRNATDGYSALRRGYPTAMVGSVDEYKLPTDYHWPSDTARPGGPRHGGGRGPAVPRGGHPPRRRTAGAGSCRARGGLPAKHLAHVALPDAVRLAQHPDLASANVLGGAQDLAGIALADGARLQQQPALLGPPGAGRCGARHAVGRDAGARAPGGCVDERPPI